MDNSKKDKEIVKLRLLLRKRNATIKQLKSGLVEVPPEVQQLEKHIFGDSVECASCGVGNVKTYVFCTSCELGWAYCKKCGGFSRAKEEHVGHITPTHGVFLDMYDKQETLNSYLKPN